MHLSAALNLAFGSDNHPTILSELIAEEQLTGCGNSKAKTKRFSVMSPVTTERIHDDDDFRAAISTRACYWIGVEWTCIQARIMTNVTTINSISDAV